ncbi:MAG: diaminobutyrate decarboxylase [Desulfobacteraceae bacterium]|nr:MAG: diaminobutyrate decarboxylase [Desulfobacteraceae bacterium]
MSFTKDARDIIDQLSVYLHQSRSKEKRAVNLQTIRHIQEHLGLEQYLCDGGLSGETLNRFVETYLGFTTRLHHPGFMAHQVGVPHPTGALASLIDGFTNNAMAIYEMGPAASAIEFFLINTLLTKIGWVPMPDDITQRLETDHGAGVLTHGGSLANLTALLAARNQLAPEAREGGTPGNLVILAPESSHYIISKSAGIIGVGEKNVVPLPTDDLGRIITEKLDAIYEKIRSQGKQVVALVANACATGTGLYDDLNAIGTFCSDRRIWFHIDGAHGACALFSKKMRPLLHGVEKADSIVLDAHKMLRTPLLCAALLLKNARPLDCNFEHTASYLFHDKLQPGFDFIGQTIECTKAGLGLKFYFTLAALGEKGISQYLEQTQALTLNAHEFISKAPDFDCPYVPQSNILCFRITGSDDLQLEIRDRLMALGHYHISSTMLKDRRYLRIVIISPDTRFEDIEQLIQEVRKLAHTAENKEI